MTTLEKTVITTAGRFSIQRHEPSGKYYLYEDDYLLTSLTEQDGSDLLRVVQRMIGVQLSRRTPV